VALVERHEGRRFGFAGQNFYVEFLAALDVDQDPERYFGPLVYEEPPSVVEVYPPAPANLNVVAQATGVSVQAIAVLNPAFGTELVNQGFDLPEGYGVRIPAATKLAYDRNVAALAGRRQAELARSGTHRVSPGQTLSGIAARYGVSVSSIRSHNGIGNADLVRVGQVLRIPPRGARTRGAPTPTGGSVTHRVRRGQTLSHIARQYGTSVSALKRHNGIRDPASLRVGQVITVPPS
jgi:membrane-bound lytic murein transglycosylase D